MKWFTARGRQPMSDADWARKEAEVVAAKEWRREHTATQRDLVDAVSAVLFRADPVGINFGSNTDEYDAEAETIVIGLPGTGGPAEVAALTHETFVAWFDSETAGPVEGYVDVAAEIWNIHRQFQSRT